MTDQERLFSRAVRNIVVGGKQFVDPEYIETNSSLIIFVGDKALKILKESKRGLDCSSREARKSLLCEEMRINMEITPSLYLGVKPIVRHQGDVIVGSDGLVGKAVEYALCMRRLREESLVRNRLLAGTYLREHSILIAKKIADFHERKLSEKLGDDQILIEKFASLETLVDTVQSDFMLFEKRKARFVPTIITEPEYQGIKNYIFGFLEGKSELFRERVSSGYVIPIHGDFRSQNIFVDDDVYVIDRSLRRNMRVGDIVKDPAYLAADLEVFGCREEREHFLGEYQSNIKDPHLEQLLPFYICRLAFVSGIVNSSQRDHCQLTVYFNLAYSLASAG